MNWENCHEYFLSKEFRDNNQNLSKLLDELSFYIRTCNKSQQRRTAIKLFSIVNKKEIPKLINEFIGTPDEVQSYLNNLGWNPVRIFSEMDGDKIKIIIIR